MTPPLPYFCHSYSSIFCSISSLTHDLLCPSRTACRPCHSTEAALLKYWLTTFCLPWMYGGMRPSWPFSICLLPSILSTAWFSSADFNLSTEFLAPFFRGLSHTSLVGLRPWPSMARVQDMGTFALVSHRAQFLVLSSSFSSLHLSALWLKLSLPPTSLLPMAHSYSSPVLLIRYTPLSCPCRHASLTWSSRDKKQTEADWQQTEALRVTSKRTIIFCFLTLSQFLFLLALPTFRSLL